MKKNIFPPKLRKVGIESHKSKGGSRGVSKVSRNWSDHLWLVFACISLIMSMLPYSYIFMRWKPVIKVSRSALEKVMNFLEVPTKMMFVAIAVGYNRHYSELTAQLSSLYSKRPTCGIRTGLNRLYV